MSATLDLFASDSVVETPADAPKADLEDAARFLRSDVLASPHPFARYGMATAMWRSQLPRQNLTEDQIRAALIRAIDFGLERFRMRTGDSPDNEERKLEFEAIAAAELRNNPNLVQSAGLAAKGIYIYPSVITTDGGAKGTWENAESTLDKLRSGEKLDSPQKFSRSFAPSTAKINNGSGSQTEPKGTLLEVACCLVTTLSPVKPAAWAGSNSTIIPDLDLPALRDFLELFQRMSESQLSGDLMIAKLAASKPASNVAKSGALTKQKAKSGPIKSEFRRPRLHSGNYPFAPRDSNVFGPVGLLAAIGRWAVEADGVDQEWARSVLTSLSQAPLYVISYEKISQIQFGNHIVDLAMRGELSHILEALWNSTHLYADIDNPIIRRDAPAYQLFYFHTARFLQSFDRPAFKCFLASRAEYPASFRTILDSYFASIMIPIPIVQSARTLGQHLNRTAYFVADAEIDPSATNRKSRVEKAKAKILVEFESAIMSAKTPEDMLFRVSTRCGRLLQQDIPSAAAPFMDAAASGDGLEFPNSQHLLIAYLRLRSPQTDRTVTSSVSEVQQAPEQDVALEPELSGMDMAE